MQEPIEPVFQKCRSELSKGQSLYKIPKVFIPADAIGSDMHDTVFRSRLKSR